jgi:hypothetical protein
MQKLKSALAGIGLLFSATRDDGEIIPASIFGVVGMQKVVENAYNDSAMPEDWDIIAIIRQDQSEAVLKEVY